jgi:hypothetical protein
MYSSQLIQKNQARRRTNSCATRRRVCRGGAMLLLRLYSTRAHLLAIAYLHCPPHSHDNNSELTQGKYTTSDSLKATNEYQDRVKNYEMGKLDMHDKPEFPTRNKAGDMPANSIRYMQSQVMMMILVLKHTDGLCSPEELGQGKKSKCSCDVGNLHISFRQLPLFSRTKNANSQLLGGRKN